MDDNEIEITVKFSGTPKPITITPESTVLRLKYFILRSTGVLPRVQKLIFKGRILADEVTLREAGVIHGTQLMLVGTLGVHRRDRHMWVEPKTRIVSWTPRMSPTGRWMATGVVGLGGLNLSPTERRMATGWMTTGFVGLGGLNLSPTERWMATGVVGLGGLNLKAIPDAVWDCTPFIRVIDVSNNPIQRIPKKIDGLVELKKLILNANGLSDGSMSWIQLAKLESITVLSISQNSLTSLPGILGHLTTLQHLDVSNNKLTTLPTEIGLLSNLEVLKANKNRISFLPENMGDCTSLVEIDVSSNLLSELPVSFGNLHNLKALFLGNNALKSLPPTLFSKCVQLGTLNLQNTEITQDFLRQLEGWDDFDKRQRAKLQMQLDFGIKGSAEFDEGDDES